ncbi:MAG: glycosyltransferase, partial [Planctomycetota bacterium]
MAHRLSDRLPSDSADSFGLTGFVDTLGDVAKLADAAMPQHHGLRVDLHCHSDASNKTGEAALNMIGCPESYSRPGDVHAQAMRRGMDFVTITDHDSIEGVESIRPHLSNVLVGEELTCWFPEDGCKMHVLVYGHTRQQHDDLQKLARNLYDVADYFEQNRLAHSVAHPIYRQNDKLERWHLERLLLLFKSFECLNGAHSSLHRDAFEPLLDKLDAAEIDRLSQVHGLRPRWPEPWKKGRTAGSDDHGLLNIGRTWTELPDDVVTPDDVIEAIRQGRTRPGGEAGSSLKLAHTFWGVAVRYYTRSMLDKNGNSANLPAALLQALVGERTKPGKLQLAMLVAKGKVKKFRKKLRQRFLPSTLPPEIKTSGLIKDLFVDSVRRRLPEHPELVAELDRGLPPLGMHDEMMAFVHSVNRDVAGGIANAFQNGIDRASLTGIFDAVGAALAHQFVLSPYYFALFHQNKERRLLPAITRQDVRRRGDRLKVALFTDTFDDVNGVARFIRDMGTLAADSGRTLTVMTSVPTEDVRYGSDVAPFRRNFEPLVSRPMPLYDELKVNIPPILEVLDLCDREQFDAIHVSTPGPMGLLGLTAAAMLRVPVLATYHTDFPAYVEKLTGDHRQAGNVANYMRWFYKVPKAVFSRSSAYKFKLTDLGVAEDRIETIRPGIDLSKFTPDARDPEALAKVGVDVQKTPHVLIYAGRVSVEKNLPLLAEAYASLCERRKDVALVVVG